MAVSAQGGSSAVENISQPPASDRAHYSRYRLTMARSLGFESRHPASPVFWAAPSAGAEHTQTRLNTASAATRNVFSVLISVDV